ncbi:MAG: glucose dehydrogenase, partial [Planctomycetaceae bacterium]
MRSLQRRASIVPGCLALLLVPAAGANPPAVPATGVGPPAVPAAGVGPPAVPGIEPPPPPREPRLAAASDEAGAARGALALPEGFVAELWAAEPDLANPVAFSIDERGRVYVCEAFRAHKGVGDNVRINDERWLDADLANDTVDERFESMLRLLGDRAAEWVVETDRLRRLVDADGDGRADGATVFATGFNRLVEGHGAGVLARRGEVWYACIPNLWSFRDPGDGVAADGRVLHTGYGVRTAIQGHDLHGLTLGPDGRVWFSIGDRGYAVAHEGRTWADPESGAVFRCEPDGS